MGLFRKHYCARLMIGAAVGALTLGAGSAWAQAKPITIPAQTLASALHDFGSQTGRPIMFSPSATASKLSPGVSGVTDDQLALAQLLQGTGLTYRREGNAFVIVQAGEGGNPQSDSAAGGGAEVEALVVTAQKKEEQIQDVPIAISAFTQKSLDAQKIEGGFDLLKAIPNVTFSKNNFSGYNFSIRGIGTKAISATTDPGVAVSFNNTTLIVNRLFEQEYFDIERVEVLRGPQGTLYGRNATSGVINVLSARPRIGEFEGDVELEAGNYNAQRVRGMVNIPVGETLAIRAAGAMTKRDGYGLNLADGSDVDDRDLWSARVTVGWEPIEQIRVNALWERFEEDDQRVRTSKQLCHHDPAPRFLGDLDWETDYDAPLSRAILSQGCLPGSLYDKGTVSDPSLRVGEAHGAYGTPNGASLPYVTGLYFGPTFGTLVGDFTLGHNPAYMQPDAACSSVAQSSFVVPINTCQPDPYGRRGQSRDLREIYSLIQPSYQAKADIFEVSIDLDITDSLTLTSQTVYAEDEYSASQDYNRYSTDPIFSDSSLACGNPQWSFFGPTGLPCNPGTYLDGLRNITPGGVFTDPQLGASNSLVGMDLSKSKSEQFNQEFRLASDFDAPFNFSMGANFTRFETLNDYYVFINALTLLTNIFPFKSPGGSCDITGGGPGCTYVDPSPLGSVNGEGHNYFRSANPYVLTSSALFGELYWQATETVKVTAGLRMTWDRKVFTPVPSQLLLHDYRIHVDEGAGPEECTTTGAICELGGTAVGGRGLPALPDIVQEWREPTGRLIVDWKPDLSFTDESLFYASYAHGYKGGGANPPSISAPASLFNGRGLSAPPTFEPEFIDAFELGTKNTLLGGALVLNGSAFYYDYEGYQVSKIVDRSAANENFDAEIWGLELEWIYSPTRNLRFNGTMGHLNSRIADGEQSIDLMDRTQSNRYSFTTPDGRTFDEWVVVKPWVTSSSNCIVPAEIMELAVPAGHIINACQAGGPTGVDLSDFNFDHETDAPNGGAGFFAELGGNQLPNAPHWTASLGAQYRTALPGGWDATLRGDFYWQSQSYARVYNTQYDKLRAWTNTNLSLWVENPDWGVTAEVYVKNVFDESPITDAFLNSDDSGLTTNVFTLDPRLVGVSVRKSF